MLNISIIETMKMLVLSWENISVTAIKIAGFSEIQEEQEMTV